MKGIVILLLLIIPILSKAQIGNYDSLVQRILKLETDQKQMSESLTKSHREFRTGTGLIIAGIIVTAASLTLSESQTTGLNTTMGMIGSVMMIAGGIIQIDSHKYIGQAGTKRIKFKLR